MIIEPLTPNFYNYETKNLNLHFRSLDLDRRLYYILFINLNF